MERSINSKSSSSRSGAEQKRSGWKGKVDQGKIINNKEFRQQQEFAPKRNKNRARTAAVIKKKRKTERERKVSFQINSELHTETDWISKIG